VETFEERIENIADYNTLLAEARQTLWQQTEEEVKKIKDDKA